MASPKVTRLIVEYVHGNKRYTVDLDPNSVRAIVVGDGAFKPHFDKVAAADPVNTQSLFPNASRLVDDAAPCVLLQSAAGTAPASVAGPDVWWFDGVRWIHPEGNA